MVDLLTLHKQFLTPHLKQGGTAVDFTMGNGHDTLWLSQSIGAEGHVYAFDIQEQALSSAAALLAKENAPNNVTLIHDSHANVANYVKEPICVGIFNLGYLPGGDKRITTQRASTLAAVREGLTLLDHGGALLIAVYPGHEEGSKEGDMLGEYLASLSRFQVCASCFRIVNSPTSPFFYLCEKK